MEKAGFKTSSREVFMSLSGSNLFQLGTLVEAAQNLFYWNCHRVPDINFFKTKT